MALVYAVERSAIVVDVFTIQNICSCVKCEFVVIIHISGFSLGICLQTNCYRQK